MTFQEVPLITMGLAQTPLYTVQIQSFGGDLCPAESPPSIFIVYRGETKKVVL